MRKQIAANCKRKGTKATRAYLERCIAKLQNPKLPKADGYGTMYDMLALTLDELGDELKKRCAMLAVFPALGILLMLDYQRMRFLAAFLFFVHIK